MSKMQTTDPTLETARKIVSRMTSSEVERQAKRLGVAADLEAVAQAMAEQERRTAIDPFSRRRR